MCDQLLPRPQAGLIVIRGCRSGADDASLTAPLPYRCKKDQGSHGWSVAERVDSVTVTDEEASDRVKAGAQFSYEEAFSRNLGWLNEWEQQDLRHKRIAIAGMGGVGGFHLLTLVRFGIGGFNIPDNDAFELVNFNRQAGATLDSIGHSKVAVMAERARQINPEIRIN